LRKFTDACIEIHENAYFPQQNIIKVTSFEDANVAVVMGDLISGHSFSEPDVIKDKLEPGVWYVYCIVSH